MEEKGAKKEEHYLVFEAGGYSLAVLLSQIEKVYFEAEKVPEREVIDLSKLLGAGGKQGKYYLEVRSRGKTVPVRVDKIEPISNLQLGVWLDFPELVRRSENRMLKGFFFDGARMISLIDFEELFGK